MVKDCSGQAKRLVEADGADEKGESLAECDGVDGDVECHCDGESEQESEQGG